MSLSVFLIGCAAAAQLNAGLRDEEKATHKAQGRCGPDTQTCGDGEIVHRDQSNICRFAPCSGGTSFVEVGGVDGETKPTFQWTGVSISDNQNFCSRMMATLGDYQDRRVDDCADPANPLSEEDCPTRYMHNAAGGLGDIMHCHWTDGACTAGAEHTCTWSFYMEDLMHKHNVTEENCAAQLLETKRSLDGLLHSVQDVYNQLMQWNAIVQAENQTIRGLLEDQQNYWDDYVSDQQKCDSLYSVDQSNLINIENEMTELRAIANPDVRSAVDVRKARGYQSSGSTSMSCPAQYPYVNNNDKKYCCKAALDAVIKHEDPSKSITGTDPSNDPNCRHRDCKDVNGNSVDCVNNTRADGKGMLSPSQTAKVAADGGECIKTDPHATYCEGISEQDCNRQGPPVGSCHWQPVASFVEMDESACQTFSSLVERVQKTHGKKAKLSPPPNCHQARTDLQNEFKEAFKVLGHLYNEEIFTMEENRTICLNTATYDYKASVEGIDGIDDQIQDAAGKIHEAQGEIARLEPMLHDVERAVDRMRTYVGNIKDKCGDETYIGHLYEGIRDKIKELQECPGRNDFIIDVPHWRPKRAIGAPTPAPTPWYEDPKASTVKSIL
jgi:hypothetical protein